MSRASHQSPIRKMLSNANPQCRSIRHVLVVVEHGLAFRLESHRPFFGVR